MPKHVQGWLVVAVLLVANVAVTARLIHQWIGNKSVSDSIPAFSRLKSEDGRMLVDYKKQPTLVQIIDPQVEGAAHELVEVAHTHLQHAFTWIVLTPDPSLLAKQAGLSWDGDVKKSAVAAPYFVRMPITEAKQFVHREPMGDLWLLYDTSGQMRLDGPAIKGGTVGALAALVDGAPRFSPHLVQVEIAPLVKQGAFVDVQAAAKASSSKKAVVVFVSDASSGCSIDAELLAFEHAEKRSPDVAFLIAVPTTWSQNKIKAFKDNLALTTPVVTVDPRFGALWNDLDDRFGRLPMNGVVARFSTKDIEATAGPSLNPASVLEAGA